MKGDDPIRSAAAGVTDSAIDHAREAVAPLLKKLFNRQLAFIQDPENVKLAKEQRKKPEWQIYQEYVHDRRLRILIQSGMLLRDLEGDPSNAERIKDLRKNIVSKWGQESLHIAEVVQTGLLAEVFDTAVRTSTDKDQASEFIEDTLFEAETYCVFVREGDEPKTKAREIVARLDANRPKFLYILSKGNAKVVLRATAKRVHKQIYGYGWSTKDDKNSLICILSREE